MKIGRLQSRNGYILTVGIFFLVAFVSRWIISLNINTAAEYDLFTRKIVITRFDSIAFGLLLAILLLSQKIKIGKGAAFLLFLAGITGLIYTGYWKYENGFIYEMFFHAAESVLILMMFPFLLIFPVNIFGAKTYRHFSNITYQMYLQHMLLLYIFTPLFHQYNTIICIILYCLLVVGSSSIVYYIFERPVMNFRESVTKKLK